MPDDSLVGWEAGNNRITDEDGDGIEDNLWVDHDWLDTFYLPNVFGAAIEDIYNTRHGNMPGHRQLEFTLKQSEPTDTYSLIEEPW